MSQNATIIDQFMAVWQSKDVDRIMSYFDENAIYTNIPVDPPNVGKAAIRATIEGFINMGEKVEFVVHHCAESADGVVMNERTDRFLVRGRWVELRIMGAFELRDGKISAWRDYFDMGQFQRGMAG